jgi:hypothetical protein
MSTTELLFFKDKAFFLMLTQWKIKNRNLI